MILFFLLFQKQVHKSFLAFVFSSSLISIGKRVTKFVPNLPIILIR
jgi:hypothetical protein